jgi:hypothetical protein
MSAASSGGPSTAAAPPKQESFKLDLKGVAAAEMATGDQQLEAGEFITTARASTEEVLTVRGAAKARAQLLCALTPEHLGPSRCKVDWRASGAMIAVASEKDGGLQLQTYQRNGGKPVESHNLGPGRPMWCEWDSSGSCLAVMQEDVGLYMWDVRSLDELLGQGAPAEQQPSAPMRLCPGITVAASFCMWSRKHQQLAIGTKAGKVIVFNKAEGVMQLHDKKGKHGAAVTCGDWLFDNRLGLASGNRVKISKTLSEKGAKWESHCKFKLSGMMSRVPKKFKDAGAPLLPLLLPRPRPRPRPYHPNRDPDPSPNPRPCPSASIKPSPSPNPIISRTYPQPEP